MSEEMSETAKKVLEIAVEYLGPAAAKFLNRQTESHMDNLPFRLIDSANIEKLSFWIGVSGKLVLDKDRAEEFKNRVKALTQDTV